MATQKKSSSKSSGAKKPQVKVADMKPAKDAKGGRGQRGATVGARIRPN